MNGSRIASCATVDINVGVVVEQNVGVGDAVKDEVARESRVLDGDIFGAVNNATTGDSKAVDRETVVSRREVNAHCDHSTALLRDGDGHIGPGPCSVVTGGKTDHLTSGCSRDLPCEVRSCRV